MYDMYSRQELFKAPTKLDIEGLKRKNQACSTKSIVQRIDFTLSELNSELKALEKGKTTLLSIKSYLSQYIEVLEAPEKPLSEPAWFPLMKMLLGFLEACSVIKDSKNRELVEAMAIDHFLSKAETFINKKSKSGDHDG